MKSVFAGHKATIFMLLVASLFYAALLFVGQPASRSGGVEPARVVQSRQLQEIRQREEVFRENFRRHSGAVQVFSFGFLTLFFLGLYLDTRLIAARRAGRPWIPGGRGIAASPWGLLDAAQVVAFLFFSEVVISGVEMAALFFGFKPIPGELLLMLNSFVRNLAVAIFIVWLVRKKFGRSLEDIGLTATDLSKNVKLGLVGYVAMVPFLVLSLMALTALSQLYSYEPPPQKVVQIFLEQASEPYLLFFTFFVALLGPVIEEIFFRGFAYKALRSRYGARRAMIATAAVFALFHMNLFIFLPIFVLGIFLAYLYEKTGSLVPSITAHVAHNLIMVTLTLFFRALSVPA